MMSSPDPATRIPNDEYAEMREAMVETQICRRGIRDVGVLGAMKKVPRHEFVTPAWRGRAYADEPLPIGGGQTISQPYIVATMVAALQLSGTERVLEIGTGCGYQAAVLGTLAKEVFTVEFRADLARSAAERLQQLGYDHVHVHCGDGTLGLVEFAPYEAMIVAAAAPAIPEPLWWQLAEGGRMIIPVGGEEQQSLLLVRKEAAKVHSERRESCRFVPLLGRFGWKASDLL